MEMLRNRHKSNTLNRTHSEISSQSKDDRDFPSDGSTTLEKEIQKVPLPSQVEMKPIAKIEMKGSENTAFSSRRSINRNTPASPVVPTSSQSTDPPKSPKSPPIQSQAKLKTDIEDKYIIFASLLSHHIS
jgi:hypothetical protein